MSVRCVSNALKSL
jgi:hypothetical protein